MEDEKKCATCRKFVRHYIESVISGGYMPIEWGHCTAKRRTKTVKSKNCCDQYEQGNFEEEFRKALQDFDS